MSRRAPALPVPTAAEIAHLEAKLYPEARPRYAVELRRLREALRLGVPVGALPEVKRGQSRAMQENAIRVREGQVRAGIARRAAG